MTLLIFIIVFILITLGSIHIYWALGGKTRLGRALPMDEENKVLFRPRLVTTILVGLALYAFAVYYLNVLGTIDLWLSADVIRIIGWVIPSLFLLRAIGDFRYMGLFKKIRSTKFAKADTRFFTPITLIIALVGITIAILNQ